MAKKSAAKNEEEILPDHLRCGRTDGKQWRCKRRVMDNLKLCEIHYLQGKHRQYKEKVPESLKLQRKRKNEEETVVIDNEDTTRAQSEFKMELRKNKKKKKLSEGSVSLTDSASVSASVPVRKKTMKQCDTQLELIRMVLEREVEKRKRNNNNNNKKKKKNKTKMKKKMKEIKVEEVELEDSVELRKELPNGVMKISPASITQRDDNNVSSHCDVKVGVDHHKVVAVTPRYFRSKNVDRVPLGKLQKGSIKKKKCHWCKKSADPWNLIQCTSCRKEFYCTDCIENLYLDTQNEVKKLCPVCRGTCSCKDCLASQCNGSESKAYLSGKSRVDRILHFHYLICMLLPVLKRLSEDREAELEREAKIRRKNISDIQIKQVEFGGNENNYCNQCKTPILDLHRSCASCSYSLCLSCCEDLCQGRTSGEIKSSMLKPLDGCVDSGDHIEHVSCPPMELGGCGKGLLDLRCIFPSTLLKEMEANAEEIVCSYDFPETLDKSSSCSLCFDTDLNTSRYKQLQKAALRKDSSDNCLFCPTVLDISGDNFEHFQKHWGKGHPIVVQDVLQSTSNLSWNPLFMFCTYLEQSITKYENNKDLLESCLDWCEVEINIRQYFTGSLKCRPERNTWHEKLKLKGWLSSQVFKEQFPAHFSEVIDALPVQEYTNPVSGLLNLAANFPHGSVEHDIGPYIYISYGCVDKEADSVTKLCYDSYDVVNIMTHSADVPLSTEQLTKIRKLLKKHKALCQMESVATEQLLERKVKGMALSHGKKMEQKGLQSTMKEGMEFFRKVERTSCISTEAKKASTQCVDNNISQDGDCGIFSDSNSDSDPEPSLHGTAHTTKLSAHNNPRSPFESSDNYKKKLTEHSGAQWDVFRRQDVPKLMEYLKRHCDELTYTHDYDYHKKMVHPILDQSIFLDSTHKMRLKEEFEIEPWTFQQHVGEAVIIPAGCPYQIRNSKCCVHAVLEFVSPENVTECSQLIDEVRLLPEGHRAKVDKLEVKKMALHSMSTAIKETRQLTCKT
ncbi:lysine-specific demethylase JMJ28-like isoform X2 [Cicer arietinum]|uniref:Lysine-specific demethylase JMJ25-like isoform X2 n=1 Tax=Cicer arietinum TaxID=3827 RepID=A0A3Q7XDK1_CICAR|nr:lysine-specific demethylase JMJ25-like isoform X2 [Cicer arietinum]